MNIRKFRNYTIIALFALLLAGCQSIGDTAAKNLTMEENPAPVQSSPSIEVEPEEVSIELSAVDTVRAFYQSYFDNLTSDDGGFANPTATRSYRKSPYLTQSLIEKTDAILESFTVEDRGGFNPIVFAQDIPTSWDAELVEESPESARVVLHEEWSGYVKDLTIDLVMVDGVWLIDSILPGSPLTPDGLVELFYTLYLDDLHAKFAGTGTGTPSYNPVDYFSYEFYTKVSSPQPELGEGDPILLAQDIPVSIYVHPAEVDSDLAIVLVGELWGGNLQPSTLVVYLSFLEGRWRIVDIQREGMIEYPTTPAGTVQAFYDGYLHESRLSTTKSGNPLSDRSYHDHPYLSADFSLKVDDILDSFTDQAGYDPFLCAQDLPPALSAGPQIGTDDHVSVLMTSSFEGYYLIVDLDQLNGSWLITDIACNWAPQAVVKAYYIWYMDYIGDLAGEFRNPLVDRAYRQSPLLGGTFIQYVDEALTSTQDGGGANPFFLAQAIPSNIVVVTGPAEDVIIVRELFGETWQEMQVHLVQENGRWLIDNIQRAD